MPNILTKVAREKGIQFQSNHMEYYTLGKTVISGYLFDTSFYLFPNIEDIFRYLQINERGKGAPDNEDMSLTFVYNLPTGFVVHIYTFYDKDIFNSLLNLWLRSDLEDPLLNQRLRSDLEDPLLNQRLRSDLEDPLLNQRSEANAFPLATSSNIIGAGSILNFVSPSSKKQNNPNGFPEGIVIPKMQRSLYNVPQSSI